MHDTADPLSPVSAVGRQISSIRFLILSPTQANMTTSRRSRSRGPFPLLLLSLLLSSAPPCPESSPLRSLRQFATLPVRATTAPAAVLQAVTVALALSAGTTTFAPRVRAEEGADVLLEDSKLYIDSPHKFALQILPGFQLFPGKNSPPAMAQFQGEESFLVSTNFAEGTSMSVTRTNAVRLLKDLGVEWWFAPLLSMADLGTAELVAELLILQRQGDFLKKATPSVIVGASIVGNELSFSFDTPLAEQVNRRTIARAIFRPAKGGLQPSLDCIWISALTSVMEGDYRGKLESMKNSFRLIE